MKVLRITVFLFLIPYLAFAQSNHSNELKDEGFLKYLIKNDFYPEAALVIHNRTDAADTLQYLKGLYYYKNNKFDSSHFFFSKVSNGSALSNPAFVYRNMALLFSRKTPEADPINGIRTDTAIALMKLIRNASLALKRDTLTLNQKLNEKPVYLLPEETALISDRMNIWGAHKRKSAFKAGLLSALVPGLGKVYAHKPKQGYSTFMLVSIFGLDAWDGYRHQKFNSPQFYIFGSLFTLFYVGNIWGSVAEVKLQNKKFDDQTDNEILNAVDGSVERLLY